MPMQRYINGKTIFEKDYQFLNFQLDKPTLLVYLVLLRLHHVKVSQFLYFQTISNLNISLQTCFYQTKGIIIETQNNMKT